MKLINLIDIQLVNNDLIFIDGEIAACEGVEAMNQLVLLRMNTIMNTSPLWPQLGNNIKQMNGKRNTKENAENIKQQLITCLSFGEIFDVVEAIVLPTDFDTLFFYVKVSFDDGVVFTLNFEFDFIDGMRYII